MESYVSAMVGKYRVCFLINRKFQMFESDDAGFLDRSSDIIDLFKVLGETIEAKESERWLLFGDDVNQQRIRLGCQVNISAFSKQNIYSIPHLLSKHLMSLGCKGLIFLDDQVCFLLDLEMIPCLTESAAA